MSIATFPLQVRGEELLLHADRAVIWPRCHTVIVADTHFGKSAHFGLHGIAVPAGTDARDRDRLERLLTQTDACRLVILGDFLHSAQFDGSDESTRLKQWVEEVGRQVDLHVVAGNHDRGAPWNRPVALRWWGTQWLVPPFRFIHEANLEDRADPQELFTLSGHVHPVVRAGNGRKGGMRVPVFWQRPAGLILPSFGSFTGGFAIQPRAGDHLFAAGSDGIVPFGTA